MRLESERDAEDFIRGLTLLGTGGGGPPEMGRAALAGLLPVECRPLAELDPDTWTATVAELGSGAGGGPTPPVEAALTALAEHAGVALGAVVPGEIGAGNVPAPIAAAHALGVPAVDGDYGGGRALPELSQAVPSVLGRSIYPVAMVDASGDVTILEAGRGAAMADRIGRALTEAADGDIAFACFLFRAEDAAEVMAHGTLTRALEAGRAIREAREARVDPVEAAAEAIGAWVLFRGAVVSTGLESGGHAFGVGRHELAGDGRTFTIWFKNESHLSWLDGEPYVTSPDCLGVLDAGSGEPLTNYDVREEQEVAVLGWRGSDAHRTPRGLELLGPRHFGFDLLYTPIENMFK